MPLTPNEAIASCAHQAIYGPAFGVGECKKRTRLAYEVASDGSLDATQAWGRTKHRVPVAGSLAPRGALLWWTGGSAGHGHVAIADGKGGVWSVDILKPGHWGHVPFATIGKQWTALRWAGVSLDIDGVQVVPTPAPKPATQAGQAGDPADISEGRPMNFFSRFRDKYNHNHQIDLSLLDNLIASSQSRRTVAAARTCRWACMSAVRAFVKVVG